MSEIARRTVVEIADHLNDPGATAADIDDLVRALAALRSAEPDVEGVSALVDRDDGVNLMDARIRPTTDFAELTLASEGVVLIGGRMNLPGHPTIDYRRYELGIFAYTHASLPSWFPGVDDGGPEFFDAELLVGTSGLSCPQVFALFSELVNPLEQDATRQELALLIAGRVEDLFWSRTAPAVAALGRALLAQRGDRLVALQAHEWGHWSNRRPYQEFVESAEDDPVVEEWLADARALTMLADQAQGRGPAEALLYDKLLRQAWYPTIGRRPDATASRLLVRTMLNEGLLVLAAGASHIDLDGVAELLAASVDAPEKIASCYALQEPHEAESVVSALHIEMSAGSS